MIAADLACALDPVILARRVGIEPDPWQCDVLRSPSSGQLLNASRQSGKSTTVALLNVHTALYQPNSLCLMLSPTLRQSGELFKKAAGLYRDLGRPVPSESETALTLTLENGSRIVSLPGRRERYAGTAASGCCRSTRRRGWPTSCTWPSGRCWRCPVAAWWP